MELPDLTGTPLDELAAGDGTALDRILDQLADTLDDDNEPLAAFGSTP